MPPLGPVPRCAQSADRQRPADYCAKKGSRDTNPGSADEDAALDGQVLTMATSASSLVSTKRQGRNACDRRILTTLINGTPPVE